MPLRWFRFGKQKQEAAPQEAAAREEEAPPELEAAAPGHGGPEAAAETARKKRRRGSRGGRGRKKPADRRRRRRQCLARRLEEPAAAKAERKQSERKPQARGRRAQVAAQRRRRRTPTRRAPLPAAKRELLISVDVGEQRVAVLEDDRVAEVYLERPERRSIAGNIYLGVVDNVLPGMEAAFVEIGLEKNGFLYVDEIVGPELEGRKGARKIQDLIKRGQTVLVQAVKDPMKSKGARLTTELSLPGRFLVYVPNGEGMGVSRRLEDQERTRLKEIVKELDAKGGGIIVRTAAEGASAEDIERDLVFLQRLWKTIQAKAERATAPELVYEEAELPLRIVRDLFAGDFVGAQIDDDRTHRRIVSYLKKTSPHMIERVHRYREKAPLFEAFGVDAEIRSTLARRVDLPSGGYLIFDYAEAFTVIDVNTGRFVGSRGRVRVRSARGHDRQEQPRGGQGSRPPAPPTRHRRDHRHRLHRHGEPEEPRDRRGRAPQRARARPDEDLRRRDLAARAGRDDAPERHRRAAGDPHDEVRVCAGDGFVVSEATHTLEIERKLREIAKGSRVQAFRIAVHPRVLALLAGPGGQRLQEVEAVARRRFFLVPAVAENGHVHLDHFEVLDARASSRRSSRAAPVEEGRLARAQARRGRALRPDRRRRQGRRLPTSSLHGAAKLVGKKVTVTVGRVLDGVAYAIVGRHCRGGDADHVRGGGGEADSRAEPKEGARPRTLARRLRPRSRLTKPAEEPEELEAVAEPEDAGGCRGGLARSHGAARRRSEPVVEREEVVGARSLPPPRRRPGCRRGRSQKPTDGRRRRRFTFLRPSSPPSPSPRSSTSRRSPSNRWTVE